PQSGQPGSQDVALAETAGAPDPIASPVSPVASEPVGPALPEAGDARAQRPRIGARRIFEGTGWVVTSLVADALMLVLAVVAALIGSHAARVHASAPALVWLFPPLVIGLLAIRGLYRQKLSSQYLDEAGHVVGACSVAAMVIIAVVAFTDGVTGQAELIARVWAFGMVYVAGSRYVLALSQRRARTERAVARRTLIFGAGRIGAPVERRLEEHPELGLRPVGFVDAYPPGDDQIPGRQAPVLSRPDELEEIVTRTGAEHVVLAFLSSRGSDAALVPIVRRCDELGLEVSLVPRLFESINVRVGLEHIGGMPLFRLRSVRPKGWQFAVKHTLDRIVAAALILLLGPLLIV